MLQRILLFIAAFSFTLTAFAQGWEEVQRLISSDMSPDTRYGNDVAIYSDRALIGRWPSPDAPGGLVHFMMKDPISREWIETHQMGSTDISDNDFFGCTVALLGNTAFIGAPGDDEDENGQNTLNASGSVYIFELDEFNNEWHEVQKIVAHDRAEGGFVFGSSIDISRKYAVIGAPSENKDKNGLNPLSQAGAAYIFKKDSVTGLWLEEQKIVASDRNEDRSFGRVVAIYENRIIIGASFASISSAYIFELQSSGEWIEVQKLNASDQESDDVFGSAVDIFSDYAIVGALLDDDDVNGENSLRYAGSAYIFKRNGDGIWEEKQKITANHRREDDLFGKSVAINDKHILVGATQFGYYYQGLGAVHAFEPDDEGVWQHTRKIDPSLTALGSQQFGVSLDLDGDQFIAGGPGLDEIPQYGPTIIENIGTAYIFEFTDTIVATQDISFDFPIKVFPNPTDGLFTIDLGISYPELQVDIRNSLGQAIYRKYEKTAQLLNLYLDGYPTGIYFISIHDGDGRSARIKVVHE